MTTDRRLLRAVPITLVLLAVAAGLALIATDHWRRGAATLGGAAALAAVFRLVLPEQLIGVLAIRSKTFDVVFALALAALMTFLVARP
ncbi:DUF3017 domain-containing protein [Nakamurella sp. YIM 132087]|uniref:DUF3017 domain-containing protein n=1 Tax=Nakamurella alba TaxID=2665158 RepID=A0A7K1FJG7_9ACTN|nr:DUF3017 domain-containing protein [Nakamurella alba]MTD14275.1 DUF3017 domain-containing protein [Nakamurella alba]